MISSSHLTPYASRIMERIPEPELMDDPARARAYAGADFSEPHEAFVRYFRSRFPTHRPGAVIDLGCGPADVILRFARAYPECRIVGVDGAAAMLALGREALARAGLAGRIELRRLRLPAALAPEYDTVISNSLLHHLARPRVLWEAVRACARAPAAVLVMDLMRPASRAQAQRLVAEHAAGEPEVLKRDFLNSLLAAYRPEELGAQLAQAGLADLRVEVVSDRHVIVWGRIP